MKFSRWLIFAVSVLLLIHAARHLITITFWPYQIEYREAAVASSAYEILSGRNPYGYGDQPNYTNVYGLALPLVSAAVAISPDNSFIAARIISALFIALNCVLLFFWISRKTSIELGLSAATLFLFYQMYTTAGAFPMALGIFFSILPILFIDIYGWSKKALAIGFLCALAGFMSKPYFIMNMAWIGLASLVAMPFRTVLSFAALSALGFTGAALIINKLLPTYFNNVFFVNLATAPWDQEYLVSQLDFFLRNNWPVFLGIVLSCMWLVLARRPRDVPAPDSVPRLTNPALAALLGGLLVFCIRLGGHTGAAPAAYLYDLISPFLLVVAAKLFHATSTEIATRDRILGEYGRTFLAGIFLVTSFSAPAFSLQHAMLSNVQKSDWETVRMLIARSENPLVSPSMASLILQNRHRLYDTGMSEYFAEGSRRRGWIGDLFPADPRITLRMESFVTEVMSNIIAQHYDLIALTAGYSPLVDPALVRKHYDLCQSVHLSMPLVGQDWVTDIYFPKNQPSRPIPCVNPQ
ncbi:MAG: hypothetical protein HY082_03775 [Gammaproteobacteria bacterium]|nr:hypothetical protein [Gammaproteobacteria bacterium]